LPFKEQKGRILLQIGEYEEAVKYFDEVLKKEKEPEIFYNKALCYLKMSKKEEALLWVNEALKISDDFLLALSLKGAILVIIREYKKAIKILDGVIRKESNNLFAYFLNIVLYQNLGNMKKHKISSIS